MPIDPDDLDSEDQQGTYPVLAGIGSKPQLPLGPHMLKADGAPVIAAAEAFLREATANSDLGNPHALRQLEKVVKAISAMRRIFRSPKTEKVEDVVDDVADRRLQLANPIETFNSRLMREFVPIISQAFSGKSEQAQMEARLRALEGLADARQRGDTVMREQYENLLEELDTGRKKPRAAQEPHESDHAWERGDPVPEGRDGPAQERG